MHNNEYISEVEFIDIFADNLRDIMYEMDISEGELARRTGLSKMAISRYLNKKRMPTLKALVNLSYVLCVPITDLIPTYAMIDLKI